MPKQATIDLTTSQLNQVKQLLTQYLPNTQVWAYGSRVKWTAKPSSDLDMVAFATPEQQSDISLLREAFDESNLPFSVDLFVWDTVPAQFKQNIREEYFEVQNGKKSVQAEALITGKWKEFELGDLIELKRGYDLPKSKRVNGNIPIVSSSGTSGVHNQLKIQAPGVVTGRYGTIGEVFYLEQGFWPLNTTLYVKDFKGNDPLFVYYLLQTISFSDYTDKGAVPRINRNYVHKAKVKAPSCKKTQLLIGQTLYQYEKRIKLNRQTNQTLEKMAQALFKSWFVDFDPVIDNALAAGNPIPEALQHKAKIRQEIRNKTASQETTNTSHFHTLFPSEFEQTGEPTVGIAGWIPKGWEISSTNVEFDVSGGSTPSTKNPDFWEGGDIHWTSPKDLSGNDSKVLLDTSRKITKAGLAKIISGLMPVDTVLMSSRAPVGYLALAKVPLAINQGYIALLCKKNLTPEYTMQFLDSIIDEIKSISGGTTFAEISKKTFRSIKLVVPAKPEIDAFTVIVKAKYDKITENIKQINALSKTRETLLPKLISGEITLDQGITAKPETTT